MCAFRETFSRPVKPISFLGLFDTVNSVPKFENAWMQRNKFPYTARSSAKVIRHAVSIDERRAKFRQDLISQNKADHTKHYKRRHKDDHHLDAPNGIRKHSRSERDPSRGRKPSYLNGRRDTLAVPEHYRDISETAGVRSRSRSIVSEHNAPSSATSVSNMSLEAIQHYGDAESDGEIEQDIQEVWFAGCHADIGGGWPLGPGEDSALSHIPLVWMVREAQNAGLSFDEVKLRALNCSPEQQVAEAEAEAAANTRNQPLIQVPTIEIDAVSPEAGLDRSVSPLGRCAPPELNNADNEQTAAIPTEHPYHHHYHHHHHHLTSKFHKYLHKASTHGKIHDVLQFRNGASHLSVVSWNIMEYLPFRRMDLQEDGSWKSITWPLPKGEVRDIPADAIIHSSVIRRMEADPEYRPGNLIVGGGGRGVRKAPKEMGMGKWLVCREEGDLIGECFVRAEKPEKRKSDNRMVPMSVTPNGPQGMFLSYT